MAEPEKQMRSSTTSKPEVGSERSSKKKRQIFSLNEILKKPEYKVILETDNQARLEIIRLEQLQRHQEQGGTKASFDSTSGSSRRGPQQDQAEKRKARTELKDELA